MFEKFKTMSRTNKIWKILLTDKYLGKRVLDNTLIKVDTNYLVVTTSNPDIKKILIDNKAQILEDIRTNLDLSILDITFV